jgi:protein TonB
MKLSQTLITSFALVLVSCSTTEESAHKENESKKPVAEVKYPVSANQHDVGGYVELLTDVDVHGQPRNVRVLKSVPEGVFDEAAIEAVQKYRYEAATNSLGEKIAVKNRRVRIDFQTEDK